MPPAVRQFVRPADLAAIQAKKALARALRAEMRLNQESIQSVAKRLGTGRTSVRRILDESNTSITLSTMSKAAAAVGLEIVLATRKMSPARLKSLAARLPGAGKTHATELEDQIVAGFYGRKIRA